MSYRHWLTMSACALLAACDGGSSNEPAPTPQPTETGTLSLAVSDAPMSGVTAVGLHLHELVMTDSNGVEHRYSLGDMTMNLLDYPGKLSHTVVDNMALPVGSYHNVYMTVVQGDGNNGCYVEDGQGRHALQVQDGQLPLMDFSVASGQHYGYTMEVDLYLGLQHDNQYDYSLNHDGMWAVNNMSMGHLLGEMDPQWVAQCEADNAALAPVGSVFTHLAYLYPATVTSMSQMADVSATPAAGRTAPIAVAPLRQDDQGNWYFGMGFLPAGTYRVGYSCLGHLDDPQVDDTTNGSFSMYADAGSVTIDAGTTGGTETVHRCGMGNGGHHGG